MVRESHSKSLSSSRLKKELCRREKMRVKKPKMKMRTTSKRKTRARRIQSIEEERENRKANNPN